MDILRSLKKTGYRLTNQRKEIISNLSNNPQTAEEMLLSLKSKKILVDLASVYRTLDLLSKQEIVKRIDFGDGKKRYELIDSKHHHHVICNNCGKVEDVRLDSEKKLLQEITSSSKFQIARHSLEFFGLCANCQA